MSPVQLEGKTVCTGLLSEVFSWIHKTLSRRTSVIQNSVPLRVLIMNVACSTHWNTDPDIKRKHLKTYKSWGRKAEPVAAVDMCLCFTANMFVRWCNIIFNFLVKTKTEPIVKGQGSNYTQTERKQETSFLLPNPRLSLVMQIGAVSCVHC